jgi:hypothetical protein
MNATSRRLMQALVNEHLLRLLRDIKRGDLTQEGRDRYQRMVAEAQRARDELEREALCE